MNKLLWLLFLTASLLYSQQITWTNITTHHGLPEGVLLFKGERSSPRLKAWYLDVDLRSKNVAVKSYLSKVQGGKEGIVPFLEHTGAIAAINGGFFDTGSGISYSAAVDKSQVLAKNIASVNRDGKTYPVTRSFFGITETRELAIDWIYHYGAKVNDIRRFGNPSQNITGTPAPVPSPPTGAVYYDLLVGIGGGPTLVKNGRADITYNEEVFWGSGVGLENRDPRTAVGYTSDQHVIMLVADGRQTSSEGVNLIELADIMISLGCVEAMNLDGGGSSQMAAGNQLINLPQGSTFQRSIPTILAVVPADSVAFLPPVYYNQKVDNGNTGFNKTGDSWTVSNIGGFWDTTPAFIAPKGNGDHFASFTLSVPKSAEYDLFGWWVAASNRCKDTPYIIKHAAGVDTIRMDQSMNGSKWNRIGKFSFNENSSGEVIISNFAAQGDYVVADAIRILSYDSTFTTGISGDQPEKLSLYYLLNNYPNPFNSSTIITYQIPSDTHVNLAVYDLLGRKVTQLLNENIPAGTHKVFFEANELNSGIYFISLDTKDFRKTNKLILLK